MAKRILAGFEPLEREARGASPLTWDEVENMARTLSPKTNLVVPKARLAADPPYKRSALGRSRGCLRQYRCHRPQFNLHIKEFQQHWVLHVDRWNPHLHAWRHILVDRGFSRFLHVAQLPSLQPEPSPTPG